jgi:hypothetical protein
VSELLPPTHGRSFGRAFGDAITDLLSAFILPGIGPAIRRLVEDSAARQASATGEVMQAVAREVGYEIFERTLQEDPKLRTLFLNSMDGAFKTGLEGKRWAFGALVRDAVLDEGVFSYSWVMSQALSEIDAPHIVALEKLRRLDDHLEEEWKANPEGPSNWFDTWRAEWDAVLTPIRATLVRTALARDTPSLSVARIEPEKRVTEFGVDLLDRLPEPSERALPPRRARSA